MQKLIIPFNNMDYMGGSAPDQITIVSSSI